MWRGPVCCLLLFKMPSGLPAYPGMMMISPNPRFGIFFAALWQMCVCLLCVNSPTKKENNNFVVSTWRWWWCSFASRANRIKLFGMTESLCRYQLNGHFRRQRRGFNLLMRAKKVFLGNKQQQQHGCCIVGGHKFIVEYLMLYLRVCTYFIWEWFVCRLG